MTPLKMESDLYKAREQKTRNLQTGQSEDYGSKSASLHLEVDEYMPGEATYARNIDFLGDRRDPLFA